MEEAGEDEDEIIKLLVQAHDLGALRLKQWALRMTVHHFKELALRGALEVLPASLLTEVLREVAVGYDRLLPSAAKGLRWELSVLPQAALTSADLSSGAGACGSSGCSEASIVATFSQPVRVRRVRVGVDLTNGDFDAAWVNAEPMGKVKNGKGVIVEAPEGAAAVWSFFAGGRDLAGVGAKEAMSTLQVWVDAAEFTDDLKVGCEVILETAEDVALSAWRTLALCRGRKKRRKSESRSSRSSVREAAEEASTDSGKSEGEAFLGV
ncbi:hypothetical protein AK812_SmicGene7963 [Symbiodinium microadriaticum]|uniref:Uncharacterized protein n=1 Tax=Symbiodinium microadriaticum TaxID=2951 RepID=A0A1Q9EM95_SYMMI|nr:hypothetical protein AK812_SmicGene7963 [Symbiodinium microadriaticum]